MKKIVGFIILCCITLNVMALPAIVPIPADKAFQFSASLKNPQTIVAKWDISPGYYLYKDRISFKVIAPNGATLGEVIKPQGLEKSDDILGRYQVYSGNLQLTLPLLNNKTKDIKLIACFQGCSFSNFCYPPITKEVSLNLTQDVGKTLRGVDANITPATQPTLSEQQRVQQMLSQHSGWLIGLIFFCFGLLLAFTPCVLPMIPILSGIIIGHGRQMTTMRGFWLSLTYVMGMAITYAVVGVIAGFAGSSIQAAMQQPWIITLFSLIFIALALSLFGLFELHLPGKLAQGMTQLVNQQKGGTYVGVAIMGVLSTLIVSPCVTAPLIGALAYIGQTGDALLGGTALFIMGLGMGVPLLIIGTFGGKLLPKAGLWMNGIKVFFGVLMLVVAIWMLSRIIPAQITMVLWAALAIICAVFMGLFNGNATLTPWRKFWRGVSLLFFIYGILLMIGAAMGNNNPLKPLANLATKEGRGVLTSHQLFTRIKTPADLSHELNNAKTEGKLTLLDFYADWCIACKEMEATTFADPKVQQFLRQHFSILQADVTANDKIDKTLQKQVGVIAPPSLLFFDRNGNELANYRLVGETPPKKFLQHLQQVLQQQQRK